MSDRAVWTGKRNVSELDPSIIINKIQEVKSNQENGEELTMVTLNPEEYSAQLANAIWMQLRMTVVKDPRVSRHGFELS